MDTEERDIWTGCALIVLALAFGAVFFYFLWQWISPLFG